MRASRLPTLLLGLACLDAASAMDFHRVGDVLVMSGPVTGNELVGLRNHLVAGRVRLVLLHESPGGDLWHGYQAGVLIHQQGLPTAVSGRCESACGLIFLAGVERFFSDGRPLAVTMLGLHGAHSSDASHRPLTELGPRMAWVIRSRTGGRYPSELLARTVYPRHGEDIVYTFHPRRFRADGPPRGVMECLKQADARFACRMIEGLDGLGIGVLTQPAVLALPPEVKRLLATLPAAGGAR
jgi:hypothetical protein